MPGLTGSVHLGARRHMRFVQETAYGAVPGSPSWTDIPILEDGMKVKGTNPRFRPDTNYGGDYRRHVHVAHQMVVQGDVVTLLWPEVAEFLLDVALVRGADMDLESYTIDHYTLADPRRYLGCVADRLVIAATGMGDADVRITLGMVAKLEEENDSLLENAFDYSGLTPVPFMFRDARILVAAAHRIDVEGFTITVENNVAAGPNVATAGTDLGTIAYAIAQQRTITLELTEVNLGDTLNEAIRDSLPLTFEAQFSHPDGHMFQIQLPEIYPEESDEDGTPSQVAKENPRFEAGVNTGGEDIVYGVDLAAGGTTTMEELTTTIAP